jgi:hypothetical protein
MGTGTYRLHSACILRNKVTQSTAYFISYCVLVLSILPLLWASLPACLLALTVSPCPLRVVLQADAESHSGHLAPSTPWKLVIEWRQGKSAAPVCAFANCENQLLASSCLPACLSVYPSPPPARMEHLGSHGTEFHEIWYVRNLRKSVEEILVSLKSDKNNGYFTFRPIHL